MSAPVIDPNEKNLAKFAHAINELGRGRSNSVGSFTMDAVGGSTTVTASNVSSSSTVLVMAETANAATEMGAGSLRIVPGKGEFVVHHTAGVGGRTFRWAAFG
jgi:hypothetical protein